MTHHLARWFAELDAFEKRIKETPSVRRYGRLKRATGLLLEATGLQMPLGATCLIERHMGTKTDEVECEVVGFNGQSLFLMPLEDMEGITPGARVYARVATQGVVQGKHNCL